MTWCKSRTSSCAIFIYSFDALILQPGLAEAFSLTIISNSSLPCSDLTFDEDGVARQRLPSTEEYLRHVFSAKGGKFYKNHMATTHQEGDENFPAMLMGDSQIRKIVRAKLQAHGLRFEGKILRSEVIKLLSAERSNRAARLTRNAMQLTDELPYKLAEDLGEAPSFDTDDGKIESGFCLDRGSYLDAAKNYLRLCMVCNAVKFIGSDAWPSYINEAKCAEEDPSCLYDPEDNAVTHGKCHELTMAVDVLRRKPDQCVLVLSDGKTLVAEEWAMEEEAVSTGCECGMDQRSYLSEYV
ncbi:hypothetical protein CAPTEDRAFT_202796 [Capitella teleta]|uniref:TGF-beta family profile domain-containing protein n=1 Tax=Capitella teleta TaxID=283909 RepID=R7UZ15_CAPTE|nr:hypothetical protein CAPTEDRAFT_202796 [Capitella teleta]|eukprot:ELU09182.1 hypothetical protein CAPTEDRAFT_202796 [Capitella teleta]